MYTATNTTLPSGAGSGLSDDAYVGVGFSTIALLAVFVIACVLAVIPLVLCSRTMKGAMVLGGHNSMVISAACHVEPVSGTRPPSSLSMREPKPSTFGDHEQPAPRDVEPDSFEMQNLLESNSTPKNIGSDLGEEIKSGDRKHALTRISQSLIRWGVVKMPASFYQQYADVDEFMGHLGFGTQEHDVEEPVDGHWYA
jgi:hypothetical protein